MTPQQKIHQFSRVLAYILERHPEEFGLIPDASGYVRIKDLLKALNETDGWRHIRKSQIDELLLVDPDPPVELEENRIRARQRQHLPNLKPCPTPPKLLYTCVRKKAYPTVSENGIFPGADPYVICCADKELAERIGRRKDHEAVTLTIHMAKAAEFELAFSEYADTFYLTGHIPPKIFTGPSLPKEPIREKSAEPARTPKPVTEAGTFFLTPSLFEQGSGRKNKGKKKKLDWKQNRKQHRRKKEDGWLED